ncbi:MAG: hypothetical protein M1833_005776 [Piccolia ochrophora]|nr:MAG: hypothetical protein M1833_005776 [Piccolia ochrophora]
MDPEGKRQRLSSWSGPSQQQPVQHHTEPATSYPGHALPPPAHHPYHDHEPRDVHEPPSHNYVAQGGYGTSINNGSSHQYGQDQGYPRPPGAPIKTRSPVDAHQPPMRPVATGVDPHHPMQGHMDHVGPSYHEPATNGNHHGLPVNNEAGPPSYAPSPISAGPRDGYPSPAPWMSGHQALSGPLVTAFPTTKRKAVRAAQILTELDNIKGQIMDLSQSVKGTQAESKPTIVEREPSGNDVEIPQADSGPQQAISRASQAAALDSASLHPQNAIRKETHKQRMAESYGELSIPIEHTTAAHKLLRWPSIRTIYGKITHNEHYVMQTEERRGLLRLYGRGEGLDLGDGGWNGPSSDSGSSDNEELTHSPPLEGLWGHGLPVRAGVETVGGITADGFLKLDMTTLERLLKSYMDNIHIMHPFLDNNRITYMVQAFGARHNPQAVSHPRSPYGISSPRPHFDARRDSASGLHKAPKRKRSGTHFPSTSPLAHAGSSTQILPERSISSALVLLVMALGKICEHRDYLPSVPEPIEQIERKTNINASPPIMTDSPPCSVRHSPTSSQSSAFTSGTSPKNAPQINHLARGHSYEPGSPVERKSAGPLNIDVIPGLAYYAYATDILGNLHGGTDLSHVQAALLAGLYAGQLGRVIESWKWINFACMACQVLVRPPKFEAVTNAAKKDLIVMAFWTCLQLESDILAELDLPPSGITRLEEVMPFPSPRRSLIWAYYAGQIGLRKLLNRVHSALYLPEPENTPHSGWSTAELIELDSQLASWRDVLPDELKWDDSDPPASDINAARLRAKYYGARYIIHRPFLHHAIHPMKPHGSLVKNPPARQSTHSSPPTPVTPQAPDSSTRRSSMAMPPPASLSNNDIDESVMKACRTCIESAMQSTSAFHGIDRRPIVTNIFGTAHAQFGNLLVLQAASRSPLLSNLVPREELDHLNAKTIQFLRNLSRISPTLRIDATILEHVTHSAPAGSTSFSSNEGSY